MSEIMCPSCGAAVNVPEKKSATPWIIGCAVAAVAVPIVVGMIGLLGAIAIPSFVKARSTAQMNACINNMRQIDGAKEQWALASGVRPGQATDVEAVNRYIKGGLTPVCPAGGAYSYNRFGQPPACSVHGSLSAPHASTAQGATYGDTDRNTD